MSEQEAKIWAGTLAKLLNSPLWQAEKITNDVLGPWCVVCRTKTSGVAVTILYTQPAIARYLEEHMIRQERWVLE